MNTKLICTAIILGLGLSSSVMARPDMARMAAQYDANGDGTVTVEEIQAGRAAEFQLNDGNGDGALSLEELQALMEQKRAERSAERFARLDTDGNGTVSVTEFQAKAPGKRAGSAATMFGLADANADNALDAAEFAALKSPEGRLWRHFARMDTDGNGVISETEFAEFVPKRGHRGGHQGR